MTISPQLNAVYRRVLSLHQQSDELPAAYQKILAEGFEELQAVLEELQTSEEEVRAQSEALIQAYQTIEIERQRYQDLFEFAPDGYLVTDRAGKIQEANQVMAQMLKVSQEFLVGKPLLMFIEQGDRFKFHIKLDELRLIDKIQNWEVRLRSKFCLPFDAALTVSAVCDFTDELINLRWAVRDITEHKQLQRFTEWLNVELETRVQERTAQLQQSFHFEAGLKRITDKVRDSLDESHILQAAVQELTLVLGLVCCDTAVYDIDLATSTILYEFTTADELTSPSALGEVVSMSTLQENYYQLLQGSYFQFCEIDTHSVRPYAILAHPIFDDQGVLGDLWLFKQRQDTFSELEIRLVQQVANQCAIAIRQARLYQASQAQIEELQKLDCLKDDFLSTISHELRSPIANVKMAAQMLKLALAQDRSSTSAPSNGENRINQYLKILEAECDREIKLVNDLLDLQRFQTVQQPLVLETIQLQQWLPNLIAPLQGLMEARQQTLQLILAFNLPPLLSNAASLERILEELLNNAYKYTPQGGNITIMVQTQADSTQIKISNTSAEIAPDQLTRIFEKFYRIPSSDPWKQSGTGLGLALVQHLTHQLGGTIAVQQTIGQLHFIVDLPHR
ncbi:PAS domain S-box protein [Phormidium sp. CLA17]|uniref:PAS domain-containing sensor histidine kinase n=1 Tax=Leptolyngbya sp. Cla-17 TaxID=2803751 RepID=UPI001492F55E|nr:ATP-binding protein [Leptolyngbya sp. Cla-17]MBM0743984.1 PAS domain S-box protein [Leptolyngbya sp. Cla-17]